jgi:hypothetical protein
MRGDKSMAIISNQLLQELRLILKEDYNLKLSLREVTEIATSLVGFFETLLKIETKNNYETQGGNHA